MTTENIGLMKALGAKMHYLDERQKVLAQNIANADTAGYRPHDLVPVDFEAMLGSVAKTKELRPMRTDPAHIAPGAVVQGEPDSRMARRTYEVSPTGNAVILEEQMVKASQNTMDYNLMTTLYQKNIGLMRMALGTGQ